MANPILLVEHASGDLGVLAEALIRHGYDRRRVAEGTDPLAVFTDIESELVFISLGRADAVQVCEALRLDPDGAIVPVIFVGTGRERVRSPADALANGGDFYFEQPIDLSGVLAKVKTYVGGAARGDSDADARRADRHNPAPGLHPAQTAPRDAHSTPPRPQRAPAPAEQPTRAWAKLPAIAWSGQHTNRPAAAGESRDLAGASLAGASDAILAQIQTREAARLAPPAPRPPPTEKPTGATPWPQPPRRATSERGPMALPPGRYTRAAGRRIKRLRRRRPGRVAATPPAATPPARLEPPTRRRKQPDPGRTLDSLLHDVAQYRQAGSAERADAGAQAHETRSAGDQDIMGDRAPLLARALTPTRGTLSPPTDVATVLHHIAEQQVTGCVIFTSDAGARSIYFGHGVPIAAASNLSEDRFDAFLLREGRITRMQARAALTTLAGQGTRQQAAALAAHGYLKPTEVVASVREHLKEIIYELFAWRAGHYLYQPELAPDDQRIMLDVAPAALIIEGIRRKCVMEQLLERLGGPRTVVTPVAGRPLDPALGLTPAERAVARQLDGCRSIEDLAQGTDLAAERVYQVLMGLVSVGRAEINEQAVAVAAATTTAQQASGSGQAADAIDRRRILEKSVAIEELDYFQILGVSPHATTYEVQRAYERNLDEFDPSRFARNIQAALAGEIREIQEVLRDARDVLANDSMRYRYAARLPDVHPEEPTPA